MLHTYNTALKGFAVRLPGNNTEAIAEAISRHPSVAYVEKNALLAPTQVPAGGYYAGDYDQWGLDRMDQQYFGRDNRYFPTRTGRGVNVYVVDSGIWYSHQEFEGRAVKGFDAFS